jgi:hypothetical protein
VSIPILCRIGWHDWSQWNPTLVEQFNDPKPTRMIDYQERRCHGCGFKEDVPR